MVPINFQTDQQDRRPLYQQLAAWICSAIETGEYRPGDRLPTENELAQLTGLSKGTIKSACALLQEQGLVRKVRGSGVYVSDGREEAPTPEGIIGALFDELIHTHGMALTDAHRKFQEQLSRSYDENDLVNVSLVDCNMETIHVALAQLGKVPGIALSAILFDDLLFTGNAMISPGCELVLTTQLHHPGVCRYTEPLNIPTEPISIRESKETIAALSKLPEDQRVCVVYRSEAFLSSVRYTWRLIKKRGQIIPCQENDLDTLNRHYNSGLPFLLPPDYMEHCDSAALQIVFRARSAGSHIIPIQYEIDHGSILHITQLIESIRSERRRRYA